MNDNTQFPVPAAVSTTGLELDVIRDWAEFEVLKAPWQALERRDPEYSVFLSWAWLAEAFRANPGRWRVVVAHRDDRLLGVLPLKTRVHWSGSRQRFETEFEAGGRLIWSEYTGFLCDPDHAETVLPHLARRVQHMPWARMSLRYVMPEQRAAAFLAAFPENRYSARWRDYRINRGETDNLLCPQVALPNDYETWLDALPSRNTRQKIRRFARRYLDSGEIRVTTASTAGGIARDLDHLIRLWLAKWREQKGDDSAQRAANNYREMLGAARRLGLLHLPVLWRDDRPLGVLAHVLDPSMGRVHFIAAGRDTTTEAPYVGLLLHSESIRWAIEMGYRTYDFGHGNEPYKYSFGASDRQVGYFTLRRRSADRTAPRFDPLCIGPALRRAETMAKSGDSAAVAAACGQLAKLVEDST